TNGRVPGDWWRCTSAGTYQGIPLEAGDRLIYLGYRSTSGTGENHYAKGPTGEGQFYHCGQFDASGGSMPGSPIEGDLWQVSVAGTAGGMTWAADDLAIYDGGMWGRVPAAEIVAVASGAYYHLRCRTSAAEWEVRRTDKSTTRSYVEA